LRRLVKSIAEAKPAVKQIQAAKKESNATFAVTDTMSDPLYL